MMNKRPNGFTLIELLVVVTIIALLAGLSFPAVNEALNAARRAEASAMCSQVRIALSAYLEEYGAWDATLFGAAGSAPTQIDSTTTGRLTEMLIGDPAADPINPRRRTFMEFSDKALVTPGTPSAGFQDPWGNPYFIVVDTDYDNRITSGQGPSSVSTDIVSSIIVWSEGQDTSDGFTVARDPKSW
ncbi:MAG: type II secretion system protein [Verrucomicrobiota bacterium]